MADAAIRGGVTALQLRAPELHDDDDLLPLARDLADRCRGAGVLFIVNDRPRIAVASGAGGAHVGHGDDPPAARERLGPDRVLGMSVLDVAQAHDAVAAGADYLGVTVWGTPTKPEARSAGLEMVGRIAREAGVPVVGIGGVNVANAREVLAAGAAGVAVISAVVAAEDPEAATRELRKVVDTYRRGRKGTG